jgi:uncharacterized membrane protein YeaQ/YmgE (transglycosylase-associated protein family)
MFQILGLLIIGIVIGLLARLILPGRQKIGLLWTMLLGVAGAIIGGLIASALGTGKITELDFLGFVIAVAASGGLLAVAELAAGGRGSLGARRDRRIAEDRRTLNRRY